MFVCARVPLVCVRKRPPRRRPPRSSEEKCCAGQCKRRPRLRSALRSCPGGQPIQMDWGTGRAPPAAYGDQELQKKNKKQTQVSQVTNIGVRENVRGVCVCSVCGAHPAPRLPGVCPARTSGPGWRCCSVSGRRSGRWGCWTWTRVSWTSHSAARGRFKTRGLSIALQDGFRAVSNILILAQQNHQRTRESFITHIPNRCIMLSAFH